MPEDKKMYFVANGEENGQPVIIRCMQIVPNEIIESEYSYNIHISWDFNKNFNNGMPDDDLNNKHNILESILAPLDTQGISYLAVVVTGNGHKDWFWYVKDVASWMSSLNSLLADHDVYPIKIEINQDTDWSIYHDFLFDMIGYKQSF